MLCQVKSLTQHVVPRLWLGEKLARSARSAVVGRALRARPPVKGTCNYLRTQSVL